MITIVFGIIAAATIVALIIGLIMLSQGRPRQMTGAVSATSQQAMVEPVDTTSSEGRRWRKFFEILLVLLGIGIVVYLAYLIHTNWDGRSVWSWSNNLVPKELSVFEVVAYLALFIILLALLFKAVQLLFTGKKGWGKYFIVSILLLLVGPLVIELSDEVLSWAIYDDVKTAETARPRPSGAREIHATWNYRNPDGTIPVGVWSKTQSLGIDCSVRFPRGIERWYKIAYRSDKLSGWAILLPNTSPNMIEYKFKVIKPGINKITYSRKCS